MNWNILIRISFYTESDNAIYPILILYIAMKERIVCAAIHNPDKKNLKGEPLIYFGLRHSDIEMQSKLVSRNPLH